MKKFATLRNFLFTTLVCILIVLSLGYSYMILSLAVKKIQVNLIFSRSFMRIFAFICYT